jgi:hypothetical protein
MERGLRVEDPDVLPESLKRCQKAIGGGKAAVLDVRIA